MGIITSIRKRGGLMVTLVGLGVFGFIVMDVVNNRNMMGQNTTVGKVNGKSLEINQMRYMEDVMYQGSNADEFSKKDYVWNNFLESSIAEDITEKIGLDVGKNELLSLEFGPNYSNLIVSRFGNPQTGEPNVSQLNQIRQAIKENKLPAELISFWSLQEKEIIKDRILEKMGNLVGKAMYVPTWQTRMMVDQQLMKTTALVVKIPYTTIPDSDVKLTDADYQKFLDGRKGAFDNEKETRSLDYIIIDAAPTAADTAQISQLIANKTQAFRTANEDSIYVETNGGKFTDTYAKAETFNEKVRAQLISLAPGEVYGPYEEAGYFKLAKMISKRTVPDSVKSRHILIAAQDEAGMTEANRKIDSIKVAIESGKTKFEDAPENSNEKMNELEGEIKRLKKSLIQKDKKLKKERELSDFWESKCFKEKDYSNRLKEECKNLSYGQKSLIETLDYTTRSLELTSKIFRNDVQVRNNRGGQDYSNNLKSKEQELQKVIDILTSAAHSIKNDLLQGSSINEFLSCHN